MPDSAPVFEVENHPIGLIAKGAGVLAFLGNRRATESAVANAFSDLKFRYLKQTHSSRVLPSRPLPSGTSDFDRPEGDAHWTSERGVALAIRTADCLPILLAAPSLNVIAAIHAGWRGIENEIILKTGVALLEADFPPPAFQAIVGPGIGPRSFEAGIDVGERLEAAFVKTRFDQADTALLASDRAEKCKVDLFKIALAQLRAAGVAEANVSVFAADTFSDPGYFSFRREGEKAGRQVSFIALL